MAEPEIAGFLSHLATALLVSGSTQNLALNALLFLYHQVLGKEAEQFQTRNYGKGHLLKTVDLPPAFENFATPQNSLPSLLF